MDDAEALGGTAEATFLGDSHEVLQLPTADLLAVLTPGVDRFGYFRALGRIQHGLDSFDSLKAEQTRYDVHFLDAASWQSARTG
ncbi:hypothetical protein AB0O76_16705 [Streptomyces sp. NPDC086554]|uniref:hypothetical protein n=1 Tax=Streptomyces sp. NPDC086554 TaxID=3154864 RepID=UPI00343E2051